MTTAADQLSKLLEPRGHRVRKQMEAAEEMGLTEEDVRRLVQKFPDRYRDLAVALGVEVPE